MAQCRLSWDSFNKNIHNGFSNLQQHEEFVDMTLAAEGYLVKVHKNLMALASPYIKDMLKSAPCPHPVLFLNSVSHDVMSYILEYVYTGEVHVPTTSMNEFIEAAKALQIVGISSILPPDVSRSFLENSKLKKTEYVSKDLNLNIKPAKNKSTIVDNLQTVDECNISCVKEEETPTCIPMCSDLEDIHTDYIQSANNNKPEKLLKRIDYSTSDTSKHNAWLDSIFLKPRNERINENLETPFTSTNILTPHCVTERMDDQSNELAAVTEHPTTQKNKYKIEILLDDPGTSQNKMIANTDFTIKVLDDPGNSQNEMKANKDFTFKVLDDPETNQNETIPNTDFTFKVLNTTNAPESTPHQVIDQPKSYNVDVQLPNSGNGGDVPRIIINSGTIEDMPQLTAAPEKQETPIEVDTISPLFTTTRRGSLQMILNRYMYNIHHTSKRRTKRRWRCVDYRNRHCKAFIDTEDEVIIARKFDHTHPFHDSKILKQGRSKSVIYNTISEIEAALTKQFEPYGQCEDFDEDDPMEDQSLLIPRIKSPRLL